MKILYGNYFFLKVILIPYYTDQGKKETSRILIISWKYICYMVSLLSKATSGKLYPL